MGHSCEYFTEKIRLKKICKSLTKFKFTPTVKEVVRIQQFELPLAFFPYLFLNHCCEDINGPERIILKALRPEFVLEMEDLWC